MDLDKIFDFVKSIDSAKLDVESASIIVESDSLLALVTILKDNLDLDFDFLMCITSIDNGKSDNFTVVYNFYSNKHKHSCDVRVIVDDGDQIPSISSLWKSADWHEREAYDLMGIVFENHPNLKRILLPDDWDGYPLRKNYEVADYYHGVPVPKDKSYWE